MSLKATVLVGFLMNACVSPYSTPPDSSRYTKETPTPALAQQQAPGKAEKSGNSPPCWVENSKCNQNPGFAYFTGSIKKTGAWGLRKLRRAAEQDALSQLAGYFQTVTESEIWQATICGKTRCEHEAGKRGVARAMLGIRGQDFEKVEEYLDQKWLHVRVRIPQVFLEERLQQVTLNP